METTEAAPPVTIVEFLTARLDEREAIARAAYYEGQVWLPEEESVIALPDSDVVYTADRKVDARHIVEWQPSAALARIAVDRSIVQEYERAKAEAERWPDEAWAGGPFDAMEFVAFHLASIDADHPDYREDWRP